MPTFGLITEGATDQQVIQAVLEGFFDPDDIDVRPFLPITDNTYKHQVQNFSNWQLVLRYCSSPKFAEAFPFVDYVVVQIDTDQCDDPIFGVPKYLEGQLLSPAEIVERVAAKLREQIDESVWNAHHKRIIFAIAVETIECWLLPLYASGQQKQKTLNCLEVLNRALRKMNLRPINPQAKEPRRYAELARPYSRRRDLMNHCDENPSLRIFTDQLAAIFHASPPDLIDVLTAETAVDNSGQPDIGNTTVQSTSEEANGSV